jgi:hypothetical protein
MTTMTKKVIRCDRCRKRYRGQPNWNQDWVAGIVVGYTCPDCQTVEENLGAEVNLVLAPPETRRAATLTTEDDRVNFIYQLIEMYPTPDVMRHKADRLEAARKDKAELVRLMRTIADDMESGALYGNEQ